MRSVSSRDAARGDKEWLRKQNYYFRWPCLTDQFSGIAEPTREALTAWIKDVGTQGIQLIGAVKNARIYDEMNETGAALMRVLGKDRGVFVIAVDDAGRFRPAEGMVLGQLSGHKRTSSSRALPARLCHKNEKTHRLVTGLTLDLATRSRTPGMARAIG
jgi:hypothetical protein